MSDVPLPSSSRSGRQAERPRSDERPGPEHPRLDLVDEEQVAATSPAFVEVTDHSVRDRTHAADGLDQLHLGDGELVGLQERVDPRRGIPGEGIDVMDVGVERADLLLVRRVRRARQREEGLPPETGLEARGRVALGIGRRGPA